MPVKQGERRERRRKEGREKERKEGERGRVGREGEKGKHTISLLVPFYVPRLTGFSYILITLH